MNRGITFKSEEKFYTSPGSRIVDMYKLKFNEDGSHDLVVCGKKDTYEEIQSHKDSCDIKAIIERATITGDMRELYKTEAFYEDMTIMPKSRVEALQSLAEAENVWNQLPAYVKEKFDSDMNKFFAQAFTDEWFSKLEIKKDIKEDIKDESEGEVNE